MSYALCLHYQGITGMGFKVSAISQPVIQWLTNKRVDNSMPLSNFERLRHEIRPCDVVLVEGRSRVAEVIKTITQSTWSHAALYIGRIHDIEDPRLQELIRKQFPDIAANEQLIVESELGMGTLIRPLSVYADNHLRLCRPRSLSYQDSQEVMRYAVSRLGTEYDVRQIFDLARFLLPWAILPRRFRSSLFQYHPGNATKTVCSTMIAEAFGFIQFPILPLAKRVGNKIQLFRRNPKLVTPSDFDYSPYFDIVKYPFFDTAHHADQRLLPWHGDLQLEGEEMQMYLSTQQNTETKKADD